MPRPNDVGVGIAVFILNDQDQILLLKRSGAHAAGCWSTPGGWVDRTDKSLLEVVKREALEEVGIDIRFAEQIGATTEDHPEAGIRSVTVYHLAHLWTGTPTILEPNKASDLQWFDLDKVPQERFPALTEGLLFLERALEIN